MATGSESIYTLNLMLKVENQDTSDVKIIRQSPSIFSLNYSCTMFPRTVSSSAA